MTCSTERVAQREAEALHWWHLHQKGLPMFRADPTDPAIELIRDEIEVILLHTEWPLLRQKVVACLALDDAIRRPVMRAGGHVASYVLPVIALLAFA